MDLCIACNSSLFLLGKAKGREILKCSVCGLGKTIELETIDYRNYHRDEIYSGNENQFKNIFASLVRKILNYKTTGRILDIGSSTGLLLSLLKREGFGVQGIEPSGKAREYANKKGVPTINGTFESAKLDQGSFDVVIMDHVFEHMLDPNMVLAKIKSIMLGRGILMINVPNFGGLSAKIQGVNWEYVLPEEHLWHFTLDALKRLLAKNGFTVVSWEAKSGIWEYANPPLELFQSFTGLKKRFFNNFLTAVPTWFVSYFKLGTGLSIIARKQ